MTDPRIEAVALALFPNHYNEGWARADAMQAIDAADKADTARGIIRVDTRDEDDALAEKIGTIIEDHIQGEWGAPRARMILRLLAGGK